MSAERPAMPLADPDRACPHGRFVASVKVGRITRSDDDPTVIAYMADVTVACEQCEEPFRWSGVPAGMSYHHPMVSPNEIELRAPLRPASADPDFGLGIPGFAMRQVMPPGSGV
jgi:hypothetical protein